MVTGSRKLLRRPAVMIALAVGAVLVVVALALFQPWKLFVDQVVSEAPPTVAVVPPAPVVGSAAEPSASGPVVLARGELISHEHATTGSVQVLGLPDGSRVLRLQDVKTSNGPRLKVWITDARVLDGPDGWRVFDDGRFTDLGDLKGNIGSSNYPLPAEVDLAELTSVSIWCDRFNVSFGAAALTPTAA
jgi:Electron transfer DM13